MASMDRGTGTAGTTAATPLAVTVPPPGPQSYVLVAVGVPSPTIIASGITGGTGSFVKAAQIITGNWNLELWVGYNFGLSAPTSIAISRSANTLMVAVARTIDVLGDASVLPTFTASTGVAAVSATADSGLLTPAVGDILFAAFAVGATTANSTARTHTGNAYLGNTGFGATNTRVETGWCQAVNAVPSSEVWPLAASATNAAIQVKWTPPAPPAPTPALLLKGLTTQAADAASSF